MLNLLLHVHNINENIKTSHNWIPFRLAALHDHHRMVQALLEFGRVESNAKDVSGRTTLAIAGEEGCYPLSRCCSTAVELTVSLPTALAIYHCNGLLLAVAKCHCDSRKR